MPLLIALPSIAKNRFSINSAITKNHKFTIWPQEVANFFVSEARRNFHAPASQVRWSTVLRCTCAMSCCAAQRRLTGASSWEVQLSAALMPAT